jgi:MoaA/NifB/PqqE/SkfB family radical SAM enzyme
MFRLSEFLSEIKSPTPVGPRRDLPGPVVIWNLIRRCNLRCRHCYSISGDVDFPGELTTPQVFHVMDELKACKVRSLILLAVSRCCGPTFSRSRARQGDGLLCGSVVNGVLISREQYRAHCGGGYDYVGVSLDGIGATHDRFRGKAGAFRALSTASASAAIAG